MILCYAGTGADTGNLNGGRPLSMCNSVYDTIDTLPSITAGMTETLDGDPPSYCTVKTVMYISLYIYIESICIRIILLWDMRIVCINFAVSHLHVWFPW